jgi:ketosteroid isomerase-like protein
MQSTFCAPGCQNKPRAVAFERVAPPWLSAFYEAYLSRDPERLDAVLDDDVTWLLAGPAERVDFFGMRRGKDEVIELITRIIPCYQKLMGFEIDQLLIQDEHVAFLGRVCAKQRETGRALRFACAHFMRFRDGRLVSMRALADSFDALEQLMGYRFAITSDVGRPRVERDESISTV